jgi:hypothetical protein
VSCSLLHMYAARMSPHSSFTNCPLLMGGGVEHKGAVTLHCIHMISWR